jgi:hypothetical protein
MLQQGQVFQLASGSGGETRWAPPNEGHRRGERSERPLHPPNLARAKAGTAHFQSLAKICVRAGVGEGKFEQRPSARERRSEFVGDEGDETCFPDRPETEARVNERSRCASAPRFRRPTNPFPTVR